MSMSSARIASVQTSDNQQNERRDLTNSVRRVMNMGQLVMVG